MRKMQLPDGLLSAGAISLLIRIGGTGAAFATSILLARVLGPERFGIYSFVIAVVMLLSIPAQFGVQFLVIRETARYRENSNFRAMSALWKWAVKMVLLISAVIVLGTLAITAAFPSSRYPAVLFQTVLAIVPLVALTVVFGGAVRGLGRANLGQVPDMLLRPVALFALLCVLVLALGTEGLSVQLALLANCAAAGASVIMAWFWLLKNRPPITNIAAEDVTEAATTKAAGASTGQAKQNISWLKSSILLGLVTSIQIVNANTDLIMLGLLMDAEAVGFYRPASTLATLVGFVLVSINAVIQPRIVQLHQRGEMSALQQLVTLAARLSMGAAAIGVLAIVLLGEDILSWTYGDAFIPSLIPLIIIAIGQMISAFFGPIAALMNMMGQERATLGAVALGLGSNIILNAALIPMLGLAGAAIATATSLALWNIVLSITCDRKNGLTSYALPVFPRIS